MAQKAVCLIANADAGFTQEDLGQIFHVSRDVIQRTLSRDKAVTTKSRPEGLQS
jgi:hypothetical protein